MFLSTKNLKPLAEFIFALIGALIEKIVNFFKMLEFEINTIIATYPNLKVFAILVICLLVLFVWRRENQRLRKMEEDQRQQYKEQLIELYGEIDGALVFNKQIMIGFSDEMVIKAFGIPEHITMKNNSNKINERWWYGQYRGSRGAVKFTQYVDFVNGKVTGWGKD